MTRNELIDKIGLQFTHLTYPQVEESVKAILGLMTDTLANDGRIEVRGFGSFCLHHKKAKIGRNPKSGKPCNVPAKRIPHFKPGKELRLRVNGGQYVKSRY